MRLKSCPENKPSDMKRKSIFPAVVLVFALAIVLAHLGSTSHPGTRGSRWVHAQRSTPDNGIAKTAFSKLADTTLSSGFRMHYKIVSTEKLPHVKNNGVKSRSGPDHRPVYDSILDCYYRGNPIFKVRSLKALAMEGVPETDFWNFAGLQTLDIDEFNLSGEYIQCLFSFKNTLSDQERSFILTVDRQGRSRIEEV